MVENVAGPSELHLKKELTALRKSRYLRDPETCSSWDSHSNPKSFSTTILKSENGKRGDRKLVSNLDVVSHETPPWIEKKRKKVYLYSWHRRSSKSSESVMKLDEEDDDMQGLVQGSQDSGTETSRIRRARKPRVSSKRMRKKSASKKVFDFPSSSLSVNQSDDTEYSNSKDFRLPTHETTQKFDYPSHGASPLFSGHLSRSKILKNARKPRSSNSHTPSLNGSTFSGGDGGSKREKHEGCSGCCSPLLSDTLRTKGCNILCGTRTLYSKKRASDSHRQKYPLKSSPGCPLLNNRCDVGGSSDDELSSNFSELELESLSRLDGIRWLCSGGEAGSEANEQRSLSQKYRPRNFDEIIGQNIIIQSLHNAISMGRIAPAYIFQGPRGTGKTSTARIFAASLNCLSTEELKPCGHCKECVDFATGHGSNMKEVDATNTKDLAGVRLSMKRMSLSTTLSRYVVFVIDECHTLSSKLWSAFTKSIDEPLSRIVFIFTTADPSDLPHTVTSRCQRYIFHKIKDADIVSRMRKISAHEKLDIELNAIEIIALNSGGSLRDAETMLDQLSLLGKRITASIVNDLVGVVSDDKLLDLLETSFSSNTTEIVKKSRELMSSGVDPVALMSQLAGLIMDILAGRYSHCTGRFLSGKNLSETELEMLQHTLKVLSDAEKQLRLSSERSTWFTAALLQLGSAPNQESILSSNTGTGKHFNVKSNLAKETSVGDGSNSFLALQDPSLSSYSPQSLPSIDNVAHKDETTDMVLGYLNQDKLDEIWRRCIERCYSMILRRLLSEHGKLASIIKTEGFLIAYITFEDYNAKSKAKSFLSSITISLEMVLGHKVEVRLGFSSSAHLKEPEPVAHSLSRNHTNKVQSDDLCGFSGKDQQSGTSHFPRRSLYYSNYSNENSSVQRRWKGQQKTHARDIDEQKGFDWKNQNEPSVARSISSKLWQDDVNHEIEELGFDDGESRRKGQVGERVDRFHCAMSPSLLHSNSCRSSFGKEKRVSKSGHGFRLCCWKSSKSKRGKVNNIRG